MKRAAWMFAGLIPVVAAAVDAQPAATPRLAAGAGWLQWGLALLLVFGSLLAFLWLLRRLSGVAGLGSRHLRILGGVSLGTRERVILLQTGNKQLVLGVCPGRIQTLCILEGEDKVPLETPELQENAFALQLNRLLGEKKNGS
ncbi:MAG: flagellar biosynthetic protein FliO [Methylococcaceae bacterium]|nr:MAG: flagellar biosynthetic protein FliO [Methylococcaceae bacterium]